MMVLNKMTMVMIMVVTFGLCRYTFLSSTHTYQQPEYSIKFIHVARIKKRKKRGICITFFVIPCAFYMGMYNKRIRMREKWRGNTFTACLLSSLDSQEENERIVRVCGWIFISLIFCERSSVSPWWWRLRVRNYTYFWSNRVLHGSLVFAEIKEKSSLSSWFFLCMCGRKSRQEKAIYLYF